MSSARLHWPAIVVAAIASFCFEGIWFSIFLKPWLAGIGRTQEWLMHQGVSQSMQFGTALVLLAHRGHCAVAADAMTGPQTAVRGIKLGAIVWVGFVATSWAKEYIFEVRTLQIFAINTIYTLLDLILIGAITGAWKRKPRIG